MHVWHVCNYAWEWVPVVTAVTGVTGVTGITGITGTDVIRDVMVGPQLPDPRPHTIDNAVIVDHVHHVDIVNPIAEATAASRPRSNSDSSSSSGGSFTADSEKVIQLCGMGFSENQATSALLAYNNNVEKACNHLLGM